MDLGYAGALVGGVLSLLSPCSAMLLPAFFAYAFGSPTRLAGRTAIFYVGLLTTLVPLGALAGTVGALLTQWRSVLVVAAAVTVIALGVAQLVGVPMPRLPFLRAGGGTSVLSVYLLGMVYGVAGVCAGPILGTVLTVAAVGSNPVYGSTLMALYALGMAAPLFLLALAWDRAKIGQRRLLRPRVLHVGRWRNSWVGVVSGALSIGIGVLLLLTDGTTSLGGVLPISAQYELEQWVLRATSGVSNVAFAFAALLLALLGTLIVRLRHNGAVRRATGDGLTASSPEPPQETVVVHPPASGL